MATAPTARSGRRGARRTRPGPSQHSSRYGQYGNWTTASVCRRTASSSDTVLPTTRSRTACRTRRRTVPGPPARRPPASGTPARRGRASRRPRTRSRRSPHGPPSSRPRRPFRALARIHAVGEAHRMVERDEPCEFGLAPAVLEDGRGVAAGERRHEPRVPEVESNRPRPSIVVLGGRHEDVQRREGLEVKFP